MKYFNSIKSMHSYFYRSSLSTSCEVAQIFSEQASTQLSKLLGNLWSFATKPCVGFREAPSARVCFQAATSLKIEPSIAHIPYAPCMVYTPTFGSFMG